MRLVADSGLWSTGQHGGPDTAGRRAGGQRRRAVVGHRRPRRRRPDHVHRSGPRGLAVAGPRRVRARRAGRGAGRTRRPTRPSNVTGVDVRPGSLEPLRRLALGHWLRRWWPASQRDGIAALDSALLDAEIAVLTAAAEDFFTDDTFDSDVAALLRPHAAALSAHLQGGDPRVIELVRTCADLADDVGIAFGEADARGAGAATTTRWPPARMRGQARTERDRHGHRLGQLGRSSARRLRRGREHRRVAHRGGRRGGESRCPRGVVGIADWRRGSRCGCGPAASAAQACSTPTA